MTLPSAALLDTSVLVRFFAEQDDRLQAAADDLRDEWLADQVQLVLLDLSVYELINVLTRKLRYDADQAAASAIELFRFRLPILAVDSRLAAAAASLAATAGVSGYDAAFVAAARGLAVPLITADRRLKEKVPTDDVVLLAA